VGFVIAGIKKVSDVAIGDTLIDERKPAKEPLPGFKEIKPMVFAGLYPVDADQYAELRDALEKLAGSTTPRSSTSPRPPPPSASASGAAFWGSCTWRSSRSASSASSTSSC